jgi:hypothetical protein
MDQRVVEIRVHGQRGGSTMPIVMRFDPIANRLLTTASGEVTFADLLEHLAAEGREGHLGAAELFDARQATTNLTSAEVRQLVEQMRRKAAAGTLGPTALVTTNDVAFGMARMYSLMSDTFDQRFTVFRSLTEAERWLNTGASSS